MSRQIEARAPARRDRGVDQSLRARDRELSERGADDPGDPLDAAEPEADPEPATDPEPAADAIFKGEVAVSAGPFADIAALSEFEAAMASLRRVDDARVRGFEGDHAVLDITLAGPIRLIEEMRRGLGGRSTRARG